MKSAISFLKDLADVIHTLSKNKSHDEFNDEILILIEDHIKTCAVSTLKKHVDVSDGDKTEPDSTSFESETMLKNKRYSSASPFNPESNVTNVTNTDDPDQSNKILYILIGIGVTIILIGVGLWIYKTVDFSDSGKPQRSLVSVKNIIIGDSNLDVAKNEIIKKSKKLRSLLL